jgi:hypothetical protein
VHSQGGEDGILVRLFELLGVLDRTFVEFGAWDGQHLSNTAHLRLHHGWQGLLLDADPERVSALVQCELVTAENVNEVFARYSVQRVFDLLSIDIDGNEYWVWQALRSFRPRVLVIEYNVFFGADVRKTIPYDPKYRWDKTLFHGASLGALHKLGREKGYSLIHTDSYAPNAFFVDDALLPRGWIAPPIEQVAAWDWAPGTEPPIAPDRAFIAI